MESKGNNIRITRLGASRPGTETAGIALGVASAVFFATIAIIAKLAYDTGAQPLPLLTGRFALACLLLLAWLRVTGRRAAIGRAAIVRLLLLGGLGYGTEATLFFLALEHAPAGVVGLIFYSYPLWTNLIGFATGIEPFRGRVMLALVLGSAGVASIFTVSNTGLLGPSLALGAAVAVAVYFILAQVLMRGIEPAASALWTSAGATVTVGVAALISRQDFPAAAVPHAFALAVASGISFVLLYAAIARIGSSRSAIANMFEPVATVLFAALILGEELTLRIAVGGALVVSALPILVGAQRRSEVSAPADSA